MRGRGLKQQEKYKSNQVYNVALHAGAWIETSYVIIKRGEYASPSMRGRGLKQHMKDLEDERYMSPSMRGRGLKPG